MWAVCGKMFDMYRLGTKKMIIRLTDDTDVNLSRKLLLAEVLEVGVLCIGTWVLHSGNMKTWNSKSIDIPSLQVRSCRLRCLLVMFLFGDSSYKAPNQNLDLVSLVGGPKPFQGSCTITVPATRTPLLLFFLQVAMAFLNCKAVSGRTRRDNTWSTFVLWPSMPKVWGYWLKQCRQWWLGRWMQMAHCSCTMHHWVTENFTEKLWISVN